MNDKAYERKVVSENLKRVLKKKNITVRQLSQATGINYNILADKVRGRTSAKPDILQKIVDYLNLDIKDIYVPSKRVKNRNREKIARIKRIIYTKKNTITLNDEVYIKVKEIERIIKLWIIGME